MRRLVLVPDVDAVEASVEDGVGDAGDDLPEVVVAAEREDADLVALAELPGRPRLVVPVRELDGAREGEDGARVAVPAGDERAAATVGEGGLGERTCIEDAHEPLGVRQPSPGRA